MSTVDSRAVLNRPSAPPDLTRKNAELTARLNVAEYSNAKLRAECDKLLAENARLRHCKVENDQLQGQVSHYSERVVILEEELRWLRAQFFGSTSQKEAAQANPDQALLFNEAEVLAAIEAAEAEQRARKTKVDAHERNHTGGRKAIPKHFPRIEVLHDLPDDQKLCTKCPVPHLMTRIGEETRECYRFEPPKISVEQHIRPTYVCEERHEDVITAPNPPVLLPKTMASPSLLAHLITSKFDDGLPLYRIARQLERSGMDLSPGTAGTWVNIVGGKKVVPLITLLNEELFSFPFLHMDESYLQVLKSTKAPTSEHYMVVRAGGPPEKRIILFDYIPSRTNDALKALLIGPDGPYRGKLLTDGLERYDDICAELKLLHFGCAQHARAYFFKARKVSQLPSSRTLAHTAIEDFFKPIFGVEAEIDALRAAHDARGESVPLDQIRRLRQEKSKPIWEKLKSWIDHLLLGTPPGSALGKALSYCTNQWPKLIRHLEHPEVHSHNNFVERQIKQYALGRKCWMFVHNEVGAKAGANLYSLVMTARANGVEPFTYLNEIFEQLPTAKTVQDFEALLPWNVKATLEARAKKARAAIALP